MTENNRRLVTDALKKHFSAEAVFCVSASLTDPKANECFLLMSEKALYTASCYENGEIEFSEYILVSVKEPQLELAGGCVFLRVLLEGEPFSLCRARLSEKDELSEAVKWIRSVCDEGLEVNKVDFRPAKRICPICSAPLARENGACPNCAGAMSSAKRIWRFIRPWKWMLFLSVLLFGVTAGINVIVPNINRVLIDDYLKSPDPASVTFAGLCGVVGAIALANIINVGVGIIRNDLLARVSTNTVSSMRQEVYRHVQKMSVAGVSKYSTGELLSRLSGDCERIASFMTGQLPALIEQMLILVVVGCTVLINNWRLGLLVLAPVPLVVILFRLIWRFTHKLYRKQWVVNSEANTVLHDIFRGIRVVKVFGTEKRELEKYERAVRSVRDISIRNETTWARIMPYANFFLGIGSFIVIYYVGNGILKGEMSLGQLTMFSGYVSLLYSPLKWMAHLPRTVQRTVTSVTKILEVMDDTDVTEDSVNAKEVDIKGEIECRDICFGYDRHRYVLNKLSVSVKPGEMLGIVGRSGAGKSTLINLMMRLYDVDSGCILVDGVDIRDIPQQVLRSKVGVVLQETFLFTGTVYENIAYAKPEATMEMVIRAAKLASAHNFIMKLPDGYSTYVGENGCTLSGGEKQRIAIARAILHDPKILILDEATSGLDTETEKDIQDALKNLIKDRTTIAIAHRLSTLRNATKLIVIDKGTVAEEGSHEELMKKRGIYYSLVMAQRQMSKLNTEKD